MKITGRIPELSSGPVGSARPSTRERSDGKEFRLHPKSAPPPSTAVNRREPADIDATPYVVELVTRATEHLAHRIPADDLMFIRSTLRDHLEANPETLDGGGRKPA